MPSFCKHSTAHGVSLVPRFLGGSLRDWSCSAELHFSATIFANSQGSAFPIMLQAYSMYGVSIT